MKRLFLTFLLATITVTIWQRPVLAQARQATPGASDAKSKAPAVRSKTLTRSEFDALLAKPEQVLLIDVRRPDEVSTIGGFPAYLSIQAADIEKSVAWIPRDRTIVTVSNHAARAGRAADQLADKGFRVAGAIGAQTYEADGGTLLKIKPVVQTADAKK